MNLPPRFTIVTCILLAAPAAATVFTAGPAGDYATVQAALDAARAEAGDHEVRVQQGTYHEHLSVSRLVSASRIALSGGWDAAFATRSMDATATTIDGDASGRVLYLRVDSGEMVVEGLTLTNGLLVGDRGAGVDVRVYTGGQAHFRNTRVTGNMNTTPFNPGGLSGFSAEAEGSGVLSVESCVIADNTAQAPAAITIYGVGANIIAQDDSRVTVTDTVIRGNRATGESEHAQGIGISLSLSGNASGVFSGNLAADNVSLLPATSTVSGAGWTIDADGHARLDARDNIASGNGADSAAEGYQTMLSLHGEDVSGTATEWLVCDALGPSIGGVSASLGALVTSSNWTVANNPGIGLRWHYDDVRLVNSIVSLNGTDVVASEPGLDPTVLVSADPLFVDAAGGDYRLRAASPAIDAGRDLGDDASTHDLAGAPRLVGTAVDLGAYEYQGSAPSHLAAVAHVSGYGGTPWRTDLAAVNATATSIDLEMTYLSGSTTTTRSVVLPAGGAVAWNDVLVDAFGYAADSSTSGALKLTAPGALVTARTFADGGAAGTYGQYYPALRPRDTITAGAGAVIPLLRSDTAFYTNIGMVNTSTTTCTATVTLRDGDGDPVGSPFDLTAAAGRWVQEGKVFEGLGTFSTAYASVEVADGCAGWLYASVVDRTTKDPTTVPVLIPAQATTLLRVPSVAHTTGYGGTPWRTSLAVVNASDAWSSVTLVYRTEGSPTSENQLLGPGEAMAWHDVLVDLFGVEPDARTAGVVEVTAAQPVVVASRTYADGGAAGTYGQYYPAVAAGATVAAGDTGVLPQIRKDDLFYTNIGILNAGSTSASVRITLRDATGTAIGSPVTRSVAAGMWAQVNDVFAAAGAGEASVAYAVVEVTSADARAWFYASVVDDTTKDPTTIPVLLAEP